MSVRMDRHGAIPRPANTIDCPRCHGSGYVPSLATIGERLKILRERDGYSLRQVERITEGKISNAYLSQIEAGQVTNIGAEVLVTLAELYRTSADFLIGLKKHG